MKLLTMAVLAMLAVTARGQTSNIVSTGTNRVDIVTHKLEYAKRLLNMNYIAATIDVLIDTVEVINHKYKVSARGQTNTWATAHFPLAHTSDFNSCTSAPSSDVYYIPASQITNAVRNLAASGDICKVFGHFWPYVWIGERKCRICGKRINTIKGVK